MLCIKCSPASGLHQRAVPIHSGLCTWPGSRSSDPPTGPEHSRQAPLARYGIGSPIWPSPYQSVPTRVDAKMGSRLRMCTRSICQTRSARTKESEGLRGNPKDSEGIRRTPRDSEGTRRHPKAAHLPHEIGRERLRLLEESEVLLELRHRRVPEESRRHGRARPAPAQAELGERETILPRQPGVRPRCLLCRPGTVSVQGVAPALFVHAPARLVEVLSGGCRVSLVDGCGLVQILAGEHTSRERVVPVESANRGRGRPREDEDEEGERRMRRGEANGG